MCPGQLAERRERMERAASFAARCASCLSRESRRLMRILSWIPSGVHLSPWAKREALLLSLLFLLNSFFFSAWPQLGQVAARPWLLLAWLYGLAMLVPLVWRDRAPVTVFIIQLVLTVAAWPFMPLYTPVVGIPVALYAVSVHCASSISLLALLACSVPIGLAAASTLRTRHPAEGIQVFISTSVVLLIVAVGAWSQGRVTGAIQRHLQHLEREREATRDAELLVTERRRIAREIHNTVSTAVTAIILQAGAARAADTDLARVRQALALIQTTAKQAMDELRGLLGLLKASDPTADPAGIGELGSQPGLADLNALLTKLRDTGMPVTTHVEGTSRNLDRSVDLAAYRIVQEGLTNALKYGGEDSNPCLRLVWETHSLLIQIDNEIHPAGAQRRETLACGHGLDGLREQAHAVGGDLHVGPHHTNGWRLAAALPLADTARSRSYAQPRDPAAPRDSSEERGDQGKVST